MSKLAKQLNYKPIVDLAYHQFKAPNPCPEAPVVITLHGLFGSGRNFGSFARSLTKDLGADVYNVDLRNHGKSEKAQPYDSMTMTADVIHFLKGRFGSDKPLALIGFSLGAKLGLLASLSKEVNIQKCVSIDMPPYTLATLSKNLILNYNKILQICRREIKVKKASPGWKEEVFGIFRDMPINENPDEAVYFSQGFVQNKENNKPFDPAVDLDPYINYDVPITGMDNLLQSIMEWPDDEKLRKSGFRTSSKTEVLFLRALNSPMFDGGYGRLGAVFPNYKIQEFNTGHVIMNEEPQKFYEACLAHFSPDPKG